MYAKILVPIDGSHNANQALEEAIRLAKSFGSQIEVIHVINHSGSETASAGQIAELINLGNKWLIDARQNLETVGVPCLTRLVEKTVAPGDVPGTIIEIAHECHAELVVIGADSKLGSVAEKVMNQCPLPVWIIRGSRTDATKT